jgi:hypothetical protein
MAEKGWSNTNGYPTVELTFEVPGPPRREITKNLFVDTGNPVAAIISPGNMALVKHAEAPDISSNFGPMDGGWTCLIIPELNIHK